MIPERLGPWWLAAAIGVWLSVLLVWGNVRVGGFALAAVLVLVAAVRGVLPEDYALALRVRSRWLDVLLYLGFAALVAVVSWSLDLS